MPIRAEQSWRGRAALAAVVFAGTVAIGAFSQPAAAQYGYDYGYGYSGPSYSYLPQSYPATPRIRLMASGTMGMVPGGQTASGRTAIGAVRAGEAALMGVTAARAAAGIAAGATKADRIERWAGRRGWQQTR